MTVQYHAFCPEGAAVTADGRAIGAPADNPSQRLHITDTAIKLHVLADRMVFATAGFSPTLSLVEAFEQLDEHSRLIEAADSGDYEEVVCVLARIVGATAMGTLTYWNAARGRAEMTVLDGRQRSMGFAHWQHVKFSSKDPHGARGFGGFAFADAEPAERLLSDGVPWTSFTLLDCIQLSRFAVQTTIDLRSFQLSDAVCGGQLSTATVTKDGARLVAIPVVQPRAFGLAAVAA